MRRRHNSENWLRTDKPPRESRALRIWLELININFHKWGNGEERYLTSHCALLFAPSRVSLVLIFLRHARVEHNAERDDEREEKVFRQLTWCNWHVNMQLLETEATLCNPLSLCSTVSVSSHFELFAFPVIYKYFSQPVLRLGSEWMNEWMNHSNVINSL